MIDNWMKNHFISDDFFNVVKSIVPDSWFTRNDEKMIRFTFSDGGTTQAI